MTIVPTDDPFQGYVPGPAPVMPGSAGTQPVLSSRDQNLALLVLIGFLGGA